MIHPQLEADCHLLGRFAASTLLLNRNAAVPWFILVPDTEMTDVLDLPAGELEEVMEECRRVSRFIKLYLGVDKVNFAGLGNVVPQMHLHIIGRSQEDPCWPSPVWGHLQHSASYDESTLQAWARVLCAEYDLSPAEADHG